MTTLAGQALATLPDTIPTPSRCELCGSPQVEIVGVYVPGPDRQAKFRPRPKVAYGFVYGVCLPCGKRPDAPSLVQAKLEETGSMVRATAGRG
jgi:hypothetical protein